MGKRSLRVVKWLGMVPALAVCSACSRNFNVPTTLLKRTSDAQENLHKQFSEHTCESLDSGQKRACEVSAKPPKISS